MEDGLLLALDAVVGGFALWAAGWLTQTRLPVTGALLAAAVAAAVGAVPDIGWLCSLVALFVLLKWFSRGDVWPDLILLVIVSR
ncbi:hypothetical protein, partial [Tamilnaduibacter salinus]